MKTHPPTPPHPPPGAPEPVPAPKATPDPPGAPRDLVGIGIGPFNLSLAALAQPLGELEAVFYDQRPAFHWHPGLLVEGATLQVPFLADLVTLADPASPWSFLCHLRRAGRLFPFYFAERFHIHRTEYDAYCRWVSESLPGLHFGHRADDVHWDPQLALFRVTVTPTGPGDPTPRTVLARNVVLGIGTAPHVPAALRPLTEAAGGAPVVHSADYLEHRERLLAARRITVVGAGQSGAEVFLDLLRRRPAGAEGLTWLARTEAFAPMEYSKLGLEHFTPDHVRYFHALPERSRGALLPRQWQLYKGIDAATLAAVHDELYRRAVRSGWPDVRLTPGVEVTGAARTADGAVTLDLAHALQESRARHTTDAVVLATGYRERPLDPLLPRLAARLRRDGSGRPLVDACHRLVLDPADDTAPAAAGCHLYVQNAERHTHGVGAPDLGLAAWRSASILNAVTGKETYPLPERTAFTTFGLGT